MNKRLRQKWLLIFPDFLELLAMGLSAGFIFERAFDQAIEALGDLELGRMFGSSESKMDVFLSMTSVISPRLRTLAYLIAQAAKRGAPLAPILLEQASFLREERLLHIEKKAQTAGVRLLFPIMLFIFPTFFLLILGSLYLQIRQQGFFN